MRGLRTVVSAVCVVVGAVLIAVWAASWVAINALEDGTIVDQAVATAIDQPEVRRSIASQISDRAIAALNDAGVNTDTPGLVSGVRAVITSAVRSDAFGQLLATQITSAREQFVAALTDTTAVGQPISITIDVAGFVNDHVSAAPVVGPRLPQVNIPSVSFQVMDVQKADDARLAYEWMRVAKSWFLWLGLGVLSLGIVVSHRRRWFFAKVSFAVAVLSALAWALVTFVSAETLAQWMPGGADGALGGVVATAIAADASPAIARRMAAVAVGAMIVSAILFAVAWSSRPARKLSR